MITKSPTQHLDRLIWSLIAAVATIVFVSPLLSHFSVKWPTFAVPALASSVLIGAARFYCHWRPDPRLASALENTAQLIAFAAVGAPLSYLAAASNLPLQDKLLDAADRAFGFDWQALLDCMNASPLIHAVLRPIYLSLTLQMAIAVLCLAFGGLLLRLRIYLLSFILTTLIIIAISALLPAAGAWPYYAPTTANSSEVVVSSSWPVFYGLRDGSFRTLMALGAEGIISFPSLHAASAMILIIALWPIAFLRWAILTLNLAMLAATPIDGSHYLSDMLAGIAVAVLCFGVATGIATMPSGYRTRRFRPSTRGSCEEATPRLQAEIRRL